jgi:hypothetical protein
MHPLEADKARQVPSQFVSQPVHELETYTSSPGSFLPSATFPIGLGLSKTRLRPQMCLKFGC